MQKTDFDKFALSNGINSFTLGLRFAELKRSTGGHAHAERRI